MISTLSPPIPTPPPTEGGVGIGGERRGVLLRLRELSRKY